MQSTPKVSIVIPVYNGANYLSQAIDSALAQTYKNVEILVINDGSTDDGKTEKIALSYENNIRYFFKENGGVGSALNFGIEKAEGEYISWLSHDDLYLPYKIQCQVDRLRRESDGVIVYSDLEVIDKESRPIYVRRLKDVEPEGFVYALIAYSLFHGCTALLPKQCFEVVGKFDEALMTTQDYKMWFRLARQYKFIHIPEVLIRSRIHSEQGSNIESHIAERDNLYKWALDEFSLDEIFAGKSGSVCASCLELAINLTGEHKRSAYKYMLAQARKNFRKTSLADYIAFALFFYRKLVKIGFRALLKAFQSTALGRSLVKQTKARLQYYGR